MARAPTPPEMEPAERPEEAIIREADKYDTALGATSPTNWWLYGLIGLGVIIAILLVMQLLDGAPATDMQPGTPTSESVVEPAVNPSMPVAH